MDALMSAAEQPANRSAAIAAAAPGADDGVRIARIGVAEYARANGMHDPEEIVAFSRQCVQAAVARLGGAAADKLADEALKAAAACFGVIDAADPAPRRAAMEGPVGEAVGGFLPSTSAAIKRLPRPVPEEHRQVMPPQPLGDLPEIVPREVWRSAFRAVKSWLAGGEGVVDDVPEHPQR
jgi:hypothetical protein